MCGCCGNKGEDGKTDMTVINKNRSCTDLIFLCLFVLFWVGMIFVAAFGVLHGNAFRLVYGYDSFGNTCDSDNTDRPIENVTLSGMNMKGRPYVFFMDVKDPFSSKCLCVNKCPDRDLDNLHDLKLYSQEMGIEYCEYDIKIENYENEEQSIKGPCPITPVHKSSPLLFYCMPQDLFQFQYDMKNALISYLNTKDIFHKVLSDVINGWREMMLLGILSLAFSGIMVILIQFLASIIVSVILSVAVVGSMVGTSFLWWTYLDMKNKLSDEEIKRLPLLDVEMDSARAFLTYAVIATVLTVILLLVVLILRKRIHLVVALFHEAGECITAMPCLLLQPVWTFIVLLGFFMYWVIVLAFISTAATPSINSQGHVKYTEHETVSYLWWYHLIGLFWTSEFIIACQQLIVSGAVATWYFSRDKKNLACPIIQSIRLLMCHHLGSVAIGAVIITAFKLPRMILMYLHSKLKVTNNTCAKYCFKCCICCLWYLEKCLKYLNQNAYTVIAIEGKNFCSATIKSYTMFVNNTSRVAAINSVGDFILFLGKIGVMAATAAVGLIWFKTRLDLHYYAVPVLLVCVFSYFIVSAFLSIYEMVIDAMLLCFCHDCEINDGSPEKQYFAGQSLVDFVDGASKKLNCLGLVNEGTAEEHEVVQV